MPGIIFTRVARISSLMKTGCTGLTYQNSGLSCLSSTSSITLKRVTPLREPCRWVYLANRDCSAKEYRVSNLEIPSVDLSGYSKCSRRALEELWPLKENRRWVSGTLKKQVELKREVEEPIVYRGAFSETLRKVKLLSLSSCFLSVLTGPIITFLTSPHLSVILKGGISAIVVILSASTTAALHWFASPYVHKIYWKQGAKEMDVEVLSWLATVLRKTIRLSDIRRPQTNRPFVTFAANGNFYFVDTDRFPNKELLKVITFSRKSEKR